MQAEPGQDDHARALTVRGMHDAERHGALSAQERRQAGPLLISTSARTRQTADLVLRELEGPPRADYRDALYLAERRKDRGDAEDAARQVLAM